MDKFYTRSIYDKNSRRGSMNLNDHGEDIFQLGKAVKLKRKKIVIAIVRRNKFVPIGRGEKNTKNKRELTAQPLPLEL